MKKLYLEFTPKQLNSLLTLIDTYSALSDGIDDDGTAKNDLKIVDEMLKGNGIKRIYS